MALPTFIPIISFRRKKLLVLKKNCIFVPQKELKKIKLVYYTFIPQLVYYFN